MKQASWVVKTPLNFKAKGVTWVHATTHVQSKISLHSWPIFKVAILVYGTYLGLNSSNFDILDMRISTLKGAILNAVQFAPFFCFVYCYPP